jgi:hypothetical protein
MLYNNTVLLPDLYTLCNVLSNNIYDLQNNCFYYGNRIAIKHYTNQSMNVVRIWKTKSLLDYWYDEFCYHSFIGALDYTIANDYIKIDYISLNDGENSTINFDFILDKVDAYKLYKSLICFIKSVAKENCKNKIILDVHRNLKLYEKYFKSLGFQLTGRKCRDNPHWVETEIILPKDGSL